MELLLIGTEPTVVFTPIDIQKILHDTNWMKTDFVIIDETHSQKSWYLSLSEIEKKTGFEFGYTYINNFSINKPEDVAKTILEKVKEKNAQRIIVISGGSALLEITKKLWGRPLKFETRHRMPLLKHGESLLLSS